VDRLGYFDGVELETEPVTGTTDQVDVTLKVKEKPTGAVLFGLGFSSSDKLIVQGSISQANIFGSGKAITLNANTSKVNRNLGLAYTNPYFTVDGVSAGFSRTTAGSARPHSASATTTETTGAAFRRLPDHGPRPDQRRLAIEQTKSS
jgi:outer membrane protein insertion porin family